MTLVKSLKKFYIYKLSDREKMILERDYNLTYVNYLIYLKSNYEDCKPIFSLDYGYEEWETYSLKEAVEWCESY